MRLSSTYTKLVNSVLLSSTYSLFFKEATHVAKIRSTYRIFIASKNKYNLRIVHYVMLVKMIKRIWFAWWFFACRISRVAQWRTSLYQSWSRKTNLKPHASTNSSLPAAWITGPATDPSCLKRCKRCYFHAICI